MKLQQLSIFLENKPGQLKMACELLAQSKINISTLSLADTKEFGILRLLIRDWEKAKSALEKGGYVVKQTEVLAVEVADRPGGLAELLNPIEAAKLNIEYMYAFSAGRKGKAVMIFRFSDPDRALNVLQAAGVNVIASVDLFGKE
jgi:hypothetical protein